MNSVTDTDCKNDNDIYFLKELSHAIGLVLDMMHSRYEPDFSHFPSSVRVSLNTIMVKYKAQPTAGQIMQRMSTMDKAMLAGESTETENDLPASLVALNKEFGLSKVDDISFAKVASFHFDRFIDPYEACRQYMLKASDLLKYAEPNCFFGGGDHLFYIPNKDLFQKDIHELSGETIIAYNNILVNSSAKSAKDETSKQAAHHDNRQWYFVTSYGWCDCPSGCIYRRNFLFVYDRDLKKASLVTTNSNRKWYSYFTSLLPQLF